MRFEELLEKEKRAGHAEGYTEGHSDGHAECEADMLRLISKMIEAGEIDKLKLLSEDAELLNEMRKKYLN
ncbi:MAG: hypothetical protein IJW18_09540 [Lachnospiraceae bacterium]|nr:hypothetical protein [Lachnospiraceae bacterium]